MLNGAPVIRTLVVGLGLGSLIALQFRAEAIRNIISNYLFTNANHLVEGGIVLCQMCAVERILGSSVLFTRLFFTAGVSILMNLFLNSSINLPQTLIFSIAPLYLDKLPPTRKVGLGSKLSISEKFLTYGLLGICFQFNRFSAGVGIVAGIVMKNWNEEILIIQNESDDVVDPIGATVEIQRKIRMDEAEERFTRQQMQRHLVNRNMMNQRLRQARPPAQAPPPYAPTDDDIASLVAMGFQGEQVRRALVATNGNLTAAAEKLINGEV